MVTLLDESMGMLLQLNTEVRITKRVRPHDKASPFTACKLPHSSYRYRIIEETLPFRGRCTDIEQT